MADSPDRLFELYEQDLQDKFQSIREKIQGNERGEQRRAALRKVEMELDESDELVAQMEIEIHGIPRSMKPQFQARLKAVKAELLRFKKLSKDAHSQLSRADLLSTAGGVDASSTSDNPYGAGSDRTRLLSGMEMLSDGSRRLMESQRIALDTEAQGTDILRTLRGQREQIENARNTLVTADTSINRASGTLKTMVRRMYQQRWMLGGIIVFAVLLIILILYVKLFRR